MGLNLYSGCTRTVVTHTVAKIAIGDCPMASGDCLFTLIAKLAKVGGVWLMGNGRLVKRMQLDSILVLVTALLSY